MLDTGLVGGPRTSGGRLAASVRARAGPVGAGALRPDTLRSRAMVSAVAGTRPRHGVPLSDRRAAALDSGGDYAGRSLDTVRAAAVVCQRRVQGHRPSLRSVAAGGKPGAGVGADPPQLDAGARRAAGAADRGLGVVGGCAEHRRPDRSCGRPARCDGGADRQFPAEPAAGVQGRGDAGDLHLARQCGRPGWSISGCACSRR